MKRLFYLGVFLLTILSSCKKDNAETLILKAVNVDNIETKAFDKWVYFSFEKGILGTYTENEFDYKNSLDWDLAFHRWDVRTNGGESGKGKGAACAVNYQDLNVELWSLNFASLAFVNDSKIKTYMAPPDMNAETDADQRKEVPANTILATWLKVSMSSIPPTYTMATNAFVIKAANGKMAAIQFTNYLSDKAVKGYVSFKYIYPLN